jgi:hypothetical protein
MESIFSAVFLQQAMQRVEQLRSAEDASDCAAREEAGSDKPGRHHEQPRGCMEFLSKAIVVVDVAGDDGHKNAC